MEEEFKVHITFTWGNDKIVEICKKSSLESTFYRLTKGPFASMGGIKGFKVIDSLDCVVVEVLDGQVIFPELASV